LTILYCHENEETQYNEHHQIVQIFRNGTPTTYKKETNKLRYKKEILYTFQIIICVLLGLEVAIKPNPYTTNLIIVMTLYICLKHDIPQKINDTLTKWLFGWKEK
jgi:hypothetical protein